MSQIIFFNHLATFGTITSQETFHNLAGSTTGWVLFWNGDSGADTWCPDIRPMSQIMFFNHLATFGTITSQETVHNLAGSTTGWVLFWNGDSGADTWCPAIRPMSEIMFLDHLATFGTIYKSAKGPQVRRCPGWVLFLNGDSGANTLCPAMEPMCQIIFFNHLATFGTITSQPRVHKWASYTS